MTNSLSAAGEVAAVAAIVNFWTDAVNNGKLSLAMLLLHPAPLVRKGHQHETRTDSALAVYVAVISLLLGHGQVLQVHCLFKLVLLATESPK